MRTPSNLPPGIRRLCVLAVFCTGAAPLPAPPRAQPEDIRWPDRVFSSLDSFRVNYDAFFAAQFAGVDVAALPSWLEVETDSLREGEQVLARLVPFTDAAAMHDRLLALVSRDHEVGLSQFARSPRFPEVNYVLGHRDGALTLVPFDGREMKPVRSGPDAVAFLADRDVFLTRNAALDDVVVVTRGKLEGVDLWYPKLAAEVMHTHTIPGNIHPTGFPEFSAGSDREMVVYSQRFQRPVHKYVLSDPGSGKETGP